MKHKLDLHVELEREGDSELFDDLQRYLRKHPTFVRLFFNPAGLTFVAGVAMFCGMAFGAIAIILIDPAVGQAVVQVAVTEIAAGREVAIPLGLIQLQLPALLVGGISAVQDLVTTTFVYPIFYWTRRYNMGRRNFVGYLFDKMAKKAEKNKRWVERYGSVGLFFFMLIPFAVNGPLIGAIIGKLAGIRTRYILPTVVLSTFTATALWTALWVYAAPQMDGYTQRLGGLEYLSLAMMAIVLLFLALSLLGFVSDLRRFRRLQQFDHERARRAQHSQTLYAVAPVEVHASRKDAEPPGATSPESTRND